VKSIYEAKSIILKREMIFVQLFFNNFYDNFVCYTYICLYFFIILHLFLY